MRVLYGSLGAILGAIVGLVAAFLLADEAGGGNDVGEGFALMGLAPIGLIIGIIIGILIALCTWSFLRRIETTSRKKTGVIIGIVIGVTALITGMILKIDHLDSPPPDQLLLSNFQKHQAVFNALIEMVQHDQGLNRVGDDWTDPDNPTKIGISQTRIAQYRKLFAIAKVPEGIEAWQRPQVINFRYWDRGSAVSSDTDKGYAYLDKPPLLALPTLDKCQPNRKNGSCYYRQITGHWYLYYDYLPG